MPNGQVEQMGYEMDAFWTIDSWRNDQRQTHRRERSTKLCKTRMLTVKKNCTTYIAWTINFTLLVFNQLVYGIWLPWLIRLSRLKLSVCDSLVLTRDSKHSSRMLKTSHCHFFAKKLGDIESKPNHTHFFKIMYFHSLWKSMFLTLYKIRNYIHIRDWI